MSDQMADGSPVSIWFLPEPHSARLVPFLGPAGTSLWGEAYLSPLASTIGFVFFGRKLNPWSLSELEWKILVQLS